MDKNALSARTGGGGKGGGKGSYADVTKMSVVAEKSSRPRTSPPLSPERITSSPPRKSPRSSGVASEMDDSEMSDGYPDADYDSDNPYHGNMYGYNYGSGSGSDPGDR